MAAAPRDVPVLVGAGQFCERVGAAGYAARAPAEIAALAGRAALEDARALAALAPQVDVLATTRTFDDSRGGKPPFGRSTNFPRSVAQRLGLQPRRCVWESAGGDTPQKLVYEFCEQIARGEARMVLLAGGEAISTVRHLLKEGRTLDWDESPEGTVEDRGAGVAGLITPYNQRHGLVGAPLTYGLLENARRARRRTRPADYLLEMAQLFAPFTEVAAANPFSAFARAPQAAVDLAAVTARNRLVADPYPLSLVAKDQVNQGAAVLLTSERVARELGIPGERWIYLHGHAEAAEREVMEREDLGASPAAALTAQAALDRAGITPAACGHFDFYSCFPIAVSAIACDALGLAADDPHRLTVTGGLPFFGGPGNNYSMHAIATMVERLRRDRQAFGFVGANGGYLSKHAAGVYSARPAPWRECGSAALQARIDALPAPARAERPDGPGQIESFTASYQDGQPSALVAAVRMLDTGARCLALLKDDPAQAAALLSDDSLGRRVRVRSGEDGVNLLGNLGAAR